MSVNCQKNKYWAGTVYKLCNVWSEWDLVISCVPPPLCQHQMDLKAAECEELR